MFHKVWLHSSFKKWLTTSYFIISVPANKTIFIFNFFFLFYRQRGLQYKWNQLIWVSDLHEVSCFYKNIFFCCYISLQMIYLKYTWWQIFFLFKKKILIKIMWNKIFNKSDYDILYSLFERLLIKKYIHMLCGVFLV